MGRLILAILAAPLLWGVVMLPFNLLLISMYPETAQAPPYPTSYLLIALILSCGYSLFAGFSAAWIARSSEPRVGIGAGIALLIVGLGVQVGQWNEIPLWYHLIFLVLLIPMCIAGTRLRKGNESA